MGGVERREVEAPQDCSQWLVSLVAGDSSQDEAEDDVKQITVSPGPWRRRVLPGQQQDHRPKG